MTRPGGGVRAALLAPAAAFGVLGIGVPTVLLVVMSMQTFTIFGWEPAGLSNFRVVLSDAATWRTLRNTLEYMAWLVPAVTVGALLIALGIRDHPRRSYLRFVLFAPSLTAGAIVVSFWRYFYAPEGPANQLLGAIGLPAQPWLIYGGPAVLAVSVVLWTSLVGSITLIYSASIAGLDKQMYEAARVDGARRGQINRLIIIPNVLPTVSLVALLTMIVAWHHLETVLLLAPATFAGNVTLRMFQLAFSYGRHGEGAAVGVFVLVVVTGLAWAKQRLER